MLDAGASFHFDRDGARRRRARRAPHPELFEAVGAGDRLLIDDGKGAAAGRLGERERIGTVVEVGGKVSNHKGVNVPGVLVPIPALTDKDQGRSRFRPRPGRRLDRLVVRAAPEDVAEARDLVEDKAALLAKIEKPEAIDA